MTCIHITRSHRFPIEVLYIYFLFVPVCKSGDSFRGLLVVIDPGYWSPYHNRCEISSSLSYFDLHTLPTNVANDSSDGISWPVVPFLSIVSVEVCLCRLNNFFTHRRDGYQRCSNWDFDLLVSDFIQSKGGVEFYHHRVVRERKGAGRTLPDVKNQSSSSGFPGC